MVRELRSRARLLLDFERFVPRADRAWYLRCIQCGPYHWSARKDARADLLYVREMCFLCLLALQCAPAGMWHWHPAADPTVPHMHKRSSGEQRFWAIKAHNFLHACQSLL